MTAAATDKMHDDIIDVLVYEGRYAGGMTAGDIAGITGYDFETVARELAILAQSGAVIGKGDKWFA